MRTIEFSIEWSNSATAVKVNWKWPPHSVLYRRAWSHENSHRMSTHTGAGGIINPTSARRGLNETKTIINATIDKRWKETHPQYDKKDHIYNLSHADQVTIFRLRCGHNRLRCHMFNCFKVGETARCECGADKQDAQHILQDCILYSDQRSAIWPTEVSLKKKLYGSCSDLRLTTEFIRTTSLTI